MAVVGIDLGTTNTVIAAVRDGRATALKDSLGRALLPSVVSFTPKGAYKVGYEAKDRRTIDPENTVFSIKRLIGRTFDSEHVQKAITRLPFTLKEGPGKSTLVSCYDNEHTLPEISAFVLAQAQKIAEARLGGTIQDAVITVPANFNDLQRAATKVAGRTAGLEVLRIINEPTAAALAYGFGKTGRERIAVYDFGGGTFDVTVLDLSENVFEVLATAGDTFLGGDDIDRAIMDRMAEELLKSHKVDANADNLVREQLRAAAEVLKIELSTRSMAKTKIEELDFEFTMRRSEFEKLTEPLLARTLEVCQEAMDVAGVSAKDLDEVLMVGGSTRIPLVRRRISSFFGKMPQSRINPDEVVAIGAAIQAASLESKQGAEGSIPAAPRPRRAQSQHPSRAPEPLGQRPTGTTQTGLAGLKDSPSGTGATGAPERPVVRGTSGTLSGMRSVPPQGPGPKLGPAKTLHGVGPSQHPSSPPVAGLGTAPRTKQNTLAGVGGDESDNGAGRQKLKTLSGVGDEGAAPAREKTNPLAGLSDKPTGRTNLGLGAHPSSVAPVKGPAPPGAIDFDDITSVNEGAMRVAAELEARSNRKKLETLSGAVAPQAPLPEPEDDPTTDGSVTFDLAELEAMAEGAGFESMEDEATQIVHPAKVAAQAARLDALVEVDLPARVEREEEEVGDSALIDYEEVGLPAPAAPRMPEPDEFEELGGSGLLSIDDELGLPSPVAQNVGLPMNKTQVGLPAPAVGLPEVRTAGLPEVRTAGLPEVRTAGLPEIPDHVDLPLVGAGTELQRTAAANKNLGLGRTMVAAPGGSPPRGAMPSVEDLDELSVATLLPEDDEVRGDELDLSGGGFGYLGEVTQSLGNQPAKQPGLGATASAGTDANALGATVLRVNQPEFTAPKSQRTLHQPAPREPAAAAAPMRGPLLIDVTPLSLGVEVSGGYVDALIQRNSPIPCEMTRTFATAQDNQAMVRVRVSQGEEERFDRNTLLGEVELTGLSPGPRGSVKVDISFSLDESGMLQVSARDNATGHAANARLTLVGVAPSDRNR